MHWIVDKLKKKWVLGHDLQRYEYVAYMFSFNSKGTLCNPTFRFSDFKGKN